MFFLKLLAVPCFIFAFSSCMVFQKTESIPPANTTVVKNPQAAVIKDTIIVDASVQKKDTLKSSVSVAKKIIYTHDNPARIAVLAPLFLDSAFNGYSYRLSKTSIPRLFMPGLEFYDGVMMAIDSLERDNEPIEVWIYDTRKRGQNIHALTDEMKWKKFSLVIASLTNTNEQKVLGEFAFANSIPIVSATYPNDANVSGNPFFILVNSTWKTHAEAVFNYAVKNYRQSNIVFVTKSGFLEERILEYFNELNTQSKNSLQFFTAQLADDFSATDLLDHLKPGVQNVVICGVLSEKFGKDLIETLNDATDFNSVVIGSPTWHGMRGTTGSACKNIQVVLTTPFNYAQNNSRLRNLTSDYKAKYNSSPSEMAYKGFETMYYFTKELTYNQNQFLSNISTNKNVAFTNFNIQPVKSSDSSFVPDYLENKKIYFVKVVNGQIYTVE